MIVFLILDHVIFVFYRPFLPRPHPPVSCNTLTLPRLPPTQLASSPSPSVYHYHYFVVEVLVMVGVEMLLWLLVLFLLINT